MSKSDKPKWTCGRCRYWIRYNNFPYNPCQDPMPFGTCYHPYTPSGEFPFTMVEQETHETFGCNHFEAKTDEEKNISTS